MKNVKKISRSNVVEAVSIGFVFSIVILFIYQIGLDSDFFFYGQEGITVGKTIELFKHYTKGGFLGGLLIVWCGVVFIYLLFLKLDRRYFRFFYKYRYVVMLILLAICVVLEINGSSMSSWCSVLGVPLEDNGVLFRTANPYRSDEFAVNTVFALAQEKNPGNSYPYFSDIVRGTSTDMYIVYGQPVKSIGIIFRPFQLGFLLFGSIKGLSFFWCGRFIFLVMSSFEFGRLFMNDKKINSIIYSIFVALSPVVQWWFAINGFVEMLIFGQLCAIMLYKYMNVSTVPKKFFCSLIFFWSGATYVLVFYPAWQVVFGYVFLGVFIWIVLENRENICWKWKIDLPIILSSGIIIGGIVGSLLFKSWNTIISVLSTAYPGHRIDNSRLKIIDFFSGIYNMYLPLTDSHMNTIWGFIDFFPLGLILALYVLIKEKKKDKLLEILAIIEVLFIVAFSLPVPNVIKAVTLLSLTTSNRALIAIQFVNILLLFRGMCLAEFKGKLWKVILGGLSYAGIAVGIFSRHTKDIPLSNLMIIGMFGVLTIVFICLWLNTRIDITRYFLMLSILVFSIGGGLVNPIQQGLPFVRESKLLQEIESIVNADSKGKWIVEGMNSLNINLALMAGAATINSTNVYPALDTWEKIDTTGQYNEVYNRYAHIEIDLQTGSDTEFVLVYPDMFKVKLNLEDLEKLSVNYILSPNTLEELSSENVFIEKYISIDNINIYKVFYR